MASTYLSKTFSSADSSGNGQKKFTVSAWVKRASTGSHQDIVSAYKAANGFQCDAIRIYDTDLFGAFSHSDSGGSGFNVRSNAKLRDTNAWYHLVTAVDTTQSTASDRVKLYINGEQVTSLSANTYPAQNESLIFGMPTDAVHEIGAVGTSAYFDGVMSHVHICFNQQYAASDFGETDSTTGEWKIKTSPSVSYGDLGGWYLKDAANGTDYSSNSNTYAVNGTLTKTEDNPSNVFATINPLSGYHGDKAILEYGNNQLKSSTGGGAQWYGASTLAFTKGKFYCEVKNITTSNASLAVGISMNPARNQYENHSAGRRGTDIATENYSGNIVIANSNVAVGYMPTWSGSGDICMLAVDADNNKFYIGKNGTWADSDNPSNGTGGYDMSSVANHSESTGFYHFSFGSTSSSYMNSFSVNFGNGYFGTTAVSSAGTNASGIGIFEYDVPTGYTALSTKGLNE
ncbi:hypothetical protein HTVC104P_gp70 [Pelagibacter phage HTVC104P]|nr:hypothetical protein HTVC104P_gp70 [Pelagibacter phage HTVC104P]